MDTKMIDMAREEDDSCCMSIGGYDNKYPIGFFLDPKTVKKLGVPDDIQPGQTVEAHATLKISSVTRREGKTECYVCVTAMGLVQTDAKTPSAKMAESYKEDEGNGDK